MTLVSSGRDVKQDNVLIIDGICCLETTTLVPGSHTRTGRLFPFRCVN
jgi:hypothetical protein